MSKKLDTCMFCGMAPCECKQKKKTSKSKPKPAPVEKLQESPPPPPPRKSFIEAMKAQASSAPPAIPKPVVRHSRPQVSDEELVLNEAIRNLAPILSARDQERYRAIITSAPAQPAELWRAKRRLGEAKLAGD